jgi:hypothetical protein
VIILLDFIELYSCQSVAEMCTVLYEVCRGAGVKVHDLVAMRYGWFSLDELAGKARTKAQRE